MRRPLNVMLLSLAIATGGCSSNGADNTTELQRIKSSMLDIVLLSPRGAMQHGKDTFFIEFRNPDGTLSDAGDVKTTATMSMAGVPMFGTIEAKRTATPGRYEVAADFSMAGSWRIMIQWGAAGDARSVTFSSVVQ